MLVGVLARVEISERQLVSARGLQLELFSVRGCEVICLWIEVQCAGDGQSSDNLKKKES